jgi:hypothetical protein
VTEEGLSAAGVSALDSVLVEPVASLPFEPLDSEFVVLFASLDSELVAPVDSAPLALLGAGTVEEAFAELDALRVAAALNAGS